MPQRRVLLVDIPSYSVPVPSPYRELLERRLKAQSVLHRQRIGYSLKRPGLSYSRGLLLVAAYMEQRGHQVRYLVYADPNDVLKFADYCKQAEVIGITAMTPVVQLAFKLFAQAKLLNPSIITILGGPHANSMKTQCLEECPELDVVIPGEDEVPFANLVNHLDNYHEEAGIIYRSEKKTPVHNILPITHRFITISETPAPAYHLLNRPISTYAHNIRTYSGCPYQCDFCIERLSWKGNNGLNSLKHVVDEIRIVTQGSPSKTLIHFSDSIFTLNKGRTIELCNLLAKERLDVVFSCDTRVDHVNEEIIRALAKANFAVIRLGMEILDDTVLKAVHKDIVTAQSMQAIELIRNVAPQMVILAYMLTGLPGSTQDTLSNAAKSIQQLILDGSVDIIGNKILVPYPGTPYFSSPEEYHMEILHHDWYKFDRSSLPVYRMENLSEYQIYFGYLFLESVQLRAYEARIANKQQINEASSNSLDYVYDSYIRQIFPTNY